LSVPLDGWEKATSWGGLFSFP